MLPPQLENAHGVARVRRHAPSEPESVVLRPQRPSQGPTAKGSGLRFFSNRQKVPPPKSAPYDDGRWSLTPRARTLSPTRSSKGASLCCAVRFDNHMNLGAYAGAWRALHRLFLDSPPGRTPPLSTLPAATDAASRQSAAPSLHAASPCCCARTLQTGPAVPRLRMPRSWCPALTLCQPRTAHAASSDWACAGDLVEA